MRGTVRRDNRALSEADALQLIREAEYGVLATVDAEGRPSTTALGHVMLDDGCLYFHTGPEGEKLDNIRANPQVSFFVTAVADVIYEQFTMAFSSAVVHGRMEILTDDGERRRVLALLVERFSDGTVPAYVVDNFIEDSLGVVTVLKLTPEHITGKARLSRRRPCLRY
jgi:nitroimidazol reductase NimA-like FMN-containing flavoprotein (pyridoxamine 5'-phosphate oxidase superfamily)